MRTQVILRNIGLWLLAPLFLLQCNPKSAPGVACKSLPRLGQNAWVRVLLDRESQEALPSLSIVNASHQSLPYQIESPGMWPDLDLSLEKPNIGLDGRGDPTVELTLRYPEGVQRRDREHLRFDLELEGLPPWLCHVDVSRRNAGGQLTTLQTEEPLHLYDFGGGTQHLTLMVPWDHDIYRLTLRSRRGALPRFRAFKVTAVTDPIYRREESRVKAKLEKSPKGYWIELPQAEPVAGAIFHLAEDTPPTLAVLTPEGLANLPVEKRIWNLPHQDTRSAHLRWPTLKTRRIHLECNPKGGVTQIELLIQRPILIFQAKANEDYRLRLKDPSIAPSQTGLLPLHVHFLPASSRECHLLPSLKPGPTQPCK